MLTKIKFTVRIFSEARDELRTPSKDQKKKKRVIDEDKDSLHEDTTLRNDNKNDAENMGNTCPCDELVDESLQIGHLLEEDFTVPREDLTDFKVEHFFPGNVQEDEEESEKVMAESKTEVGT